MQTLTDLQGQALCSFARASIGAVLGGPAAVAPEGSFASSRGACFVTLRWARASAASTNPDQSSGASADSATDDGEEELQGCIGSLEPHRSLVDDVAENAVAAALRDPRGRKLQLADLDSLEVELSILSPMTVLPVHSEEEAIAALRPHEDGAVLVSGRRRGTFLPQVWDSLPDPREFLYQLKRKAGLPMLGWDPSYQLLRYSVQKWKNRAPKTK
jgi:AmmeMemoRadiSam system protein A